MRFFRTTKRHKNYWKNRKIDWDKEYLQTWNHPHRYLISQILAPLNWFSLIEIGCGSGPNLKNIAMTLKDKQLGGVDVSEDAIAVARKAFVGGLFKVNSGDDIMLSDKSTDVTLTDMTLIYVGPKDIDRYIQEMKRITRNYAVFCEFHSNSWWNRFALKWNSGYNSYNYKKLLKKHGFFDVAIYKIPSAAWPDGDPVQQMFGHIVVARVPKK